ncbi:MAG: glutathione S-transferase family protein [Hyphomicrobiaceae bacterium]
MPSYRLHCFAQSGNAYKVALYLNCAALDWEPVFVDFMQGGQTREPSWRAANNEMGEVPILEAEGRRLSQSGAILTYLAEKTGKFAPKGPDENYEALRWILFDNHKFTGYFATHRFMRSFMPAEPDPAVLAFLKSRWEAAAKVVEMHLLRRPFLLGKAPTIADFSLAGYLFFGPEETGINLVKDYPNIYAWTERMTALPGWVGPYELMPGDRVAPLPVPRPIAQEA